MKKIVVMLACCFICTVGVAYAETQEELLETLKKIDITGIVNDSFDLGAKCGIALLDENYKRAKLGGKMSDEESNRFLATCRSKAHDQIALKLTKIVSSLKK